MYDGQQRIYKEKKKMDEGSISSIAVRTIVIPDVLSAKWFVVFCHVWPGILRF
jgi:hypothetical protein